MKSVFAVILAGGIGARMGSAEKPKQFLMLGSKPILIHTLEKFILSPDFAQILVLTPKAWVQYTCDLVAKYLPGLSGVRVIAGGATRNETIMNAIDDIEENHGLTDDTVIVTHDSVRPFVTHRIIDDNIALARQYGATDTVIPASDTIVQSLDGRAISDIPDRSKMYQGQTPQSFKAKELRALYRALSDSEREILTDACKIFVIKGRPVQLVEGEVFNIKITYPYDIRMAQAILGGDDFA